MVPDNDLLERDIYPEKGGDSIFLRIDEIAAPVTLFVGRNGTGKSGSRTARALAKRVGGHYLSTDRLLAVSGVAQSAAGATLLLDNFSGLSLSQAALSYRTAAETYGSAAEEYYELAGEPEVFLRVAALLRRVVGRGIEMRETNGYLDPQVTTTEATYSLFRSEGHGLRELAALAVAIYRNDWSFLVVDEPELHLHPAALRSWLNALAQVCGATGRRAVVVTHEPTVIFTEDVARLESIWVFQQTMPPVKLSSLVKDFTSKAAAGGLKQNPRLVGQLLFAPQPILVEGPSDVAALAEALKRNCEPELLPNYELISCGGSAGVAAWLVAARRAGIQARAVADLDACVTQDVYRAMDRLPEVAERYRNELAAEPADTRTVLKPLLEEMSRTGIPSDARARSKWLSAIPPNTPGHTSRRDALLRIWADAGLRLHPEGTLENVLGVEKDTIESARDAAAKPGLIDDVARWILTERDTIQDELWRLLGNTVERIAQDIQNRLGLDPGLDIRAISNAGRYAPLVDITKLDAEDSFRIVVKTPREYAGYWLIFDRGTPPSKLRLNDPAALMELH